MIYAGFNGHSQSSVTFAAMVFLGIRFTGTLAEWDQALFKKINTDWANSFFDAVLPLLRISYHWLPLYVFIFGLVLLNFKTKGVWWIVFFLCTVALTDMTGTYIFKHNFERWRPCADPEFSSQVRMIIQHCGGGYSFISNHAANHFGMAVFFFITFRHLLKVWGYVALLWAASIAYSQVYTGVHYPIDVLTGATLGIIFGISTGTFFNKRFRFATFANQSNL